MTGAKTKIMLLVFALLAFSLAFQGSRGLWERDEGRYTNIALRMLETDDFIVPSFNDDVPHFAKPPLTYWAIAGGITLLGWNEWGARLPNALAFVATILIVFALAHRIMPESAWLPPLIYATFLFPFSAANIITTDTLLTLWEALAVLGFVEWWHGKQRTRISPLPLMVMWGGFGLAFLTKGPPGLLPLIAIIAFVALSEGWRTLPRLFSLAGMVLFIAVGFGWYLLVVTTHPGLLTYFIKDEFVNRIATGTHHRNQQWYKPFIIYIPVILCGTIPWTLPLLKAIRSIPATLLSRPWWRDKLTHDQWPVFLVLWTVLPLAVFFMSRSRLPLYILPLFVPLALGIGRFTHITRRSNTAFIYFLAAWIIMLPLLKLGGSFYPFALDSRAMARSIRETVQPLPTEVVFVDNEPFWGLNLYLHCEVERVSNPAENAQRKPSEETLSEELSERESGTLLVVERPDVDRVIAECRKLGLHARVLGEHRAWFFISPTPEFTRASKPFMK
ncbi:MAG: glycosyltransferase family 39 protein [Syntrophaceae bacterium]